MRLLERLTVRTCAIAQVITNIIKRSTKVKYDELLEFERTRRTELEQTNTAATAALKAELRNLYTTMEKDITNAREERHQLEKSHRYAFAIEGTSLLTCDTGNNFKSLRKPTESRRSDMTKNSTS